MKFFVIIIISVIAIACNMTPEQRCSIMKNSTKFGLSIALNNLENKYFKEKNTSALTDHCEEISFIIEKTLVSKLKGDNAGSITHNEINAALLILDKKLSMEEKVVIQAGVNLALDFVPTNQSDKGIGSTLAHLLGCMLQGVLDIFKNKATKLKSIKEKNIKSIAPKQFTLLLEKK